MNNHETTTAPQPTVKPDVAPSPTTTPRPTQTPFTPSIEPETTPKG